VRCLWALRRPLLWRCPHAAANDYNTAAVRDVASFMFRPVIQRDNRHRDYGSRRKRTTATPGGNSRLLKAITLECLAVFIDKI